jgi:hypothetical protein
MPRHPFVESFDLEAAFADVSDYWSPKVVAQVNDQYVWQVPSNAKTP